MEKREAIDVQMNYLQTAKMELLRIIVFAQLIFNLVVAIRGIFTDFSLFGIISQFFMVFLMFVIAYLQYKKWRVNHLLILVTLFYTVVVVPILWYILGTMHALPVMMSIYSVLQIILLFENRLRLILLAIYAFVSTIISAHDIYYVSQMEGINVAINRSISLYISFTLICLMVWVFKAKFLLIHKKLYDNSIRDNLTGVFNSGVLDTQLEHKKGLFTEFNINFSIVMIDMDNFKKVNDIYGHDIGNHVLVAFTKLAGEIIREHDILTRYGGDEFLIVFHSCDKNKAKMIIERLLDVTTDLREKYKDINLSFSAGICDYKESLTLNKDIIKLADDRMYLAKKQGKSSIHSG